MTPLKGANGEISAVAQGKLVISGFGVGGSDCSLISVIVPCAWLFPNCASVERPSPTTLGGEDSLVLNLMNADFTTAKRVADAIYYSLCDNMSVPLDATSI